MSSPTAIASTPLGAGGTMAHGMDFHAGRTAPTR